MNSGTRSKAGRRWTWTLLAIMALAVSCRSAFSRDDPVLKKTAEQMTNADISRLAAIVSTNYGSFRIRLHPEWGPLACRNFIKLVQAGFYDGLTFHEVRPGIWVRGGDAAGDGSGQLSYKLALERPSGPHVKGAVGLYHPDAFTEEGGSQFYIMLTNYKRMDNYYTVFGIVDEGLAAVERIGKLPVTPSDGQPRPYMPLNPIIIINIHLEARQGTGK